MPPIVTPIVAIAALLILIFTLASLYSIEKNTSETKKSLADIKKLIIEYLKIKEEESDQ
mgnify:CR=1 FL=1